MIEKYGTLHEAQLLPRSFGDGSLVKGQLTPARRQAAHARACPPRCAACRSGKVTPRKALLHPKLPDQKQVRRIFKEIESHGRADRAQPLHRRRDGRGRGNRMKLAYWPGCVSRGFTPELHGSVAKVAPLLDLELVELDRANCCGAGVIAEHNQELADTLNARTFAMAQSVRGRRRDDEHLLHLPGRAVRVPGAPRRRASAYRAEVNTHLEPEGLSYEAGGDWWNKNFLWILVEEIGLDALRERVEAAARGAADRAVLRLLHRAPDQAARLRRAPGARPVPRAADRGARRRAGRVRRRAQVLRLPGDHDEPHHLAAPGRPPPGGRDRRRRRLPRHALPALPPEPRPAAAGGRSSSWSATSACRCCTCRRWSASRSGLEPKELGMGKHVVSTGDVQRKVAAARRGLKQKRPGRLRDVRVETAVIPAWRYRQVIFG